MKISDWIKVKLDIYFSPDPALSFPKRVVGPGEEEDDEDEEEGELFVSSRFRVTTRDDRVLFVYGRDQAEACGRIPSALLLNARVEPAGHVEGGVVRFPPEELRQVMGSMQDGRRAPGA